MFARLSGLVVCTLSLLIAAAVRADCLAPAPRILWSYPAEGAKEVPVDAELWVFSSLASRGARPEVSLNGRTIEGASAAPATAPHIDPTDLQIRPGRLEPNTPYTLELRYAASAGVLESVFELHFTTGAGRATAGLSPKVVAHAADPMERAGAAACALLFAAEDCFDTITGPPTQLHSFKLAPSPALAWFMRVQREGERSGGLLWPASCGDPRLVVRESRPNECFELQAIAPGGKLSTPLKYCAPKRPGKAPSGKLAELALSPREPARMIKPKAPEPLPEPAAPAPTAATAHDEKTAPPSAFGCSVTVGRNHTWKLALLQTCLLLLARARRLLS